MNYFIQNLSCGKREKAQIFKERWISQRKCYFDLQMIYNIDTKPVYNEEF